MKIWLSVLFVFLSSVSLFAQSILGFWKSFDEDTGMPQCVLGFYEYEGLYYGRIIGSYNDEGVMFDTIYDPKERAPGIVGNPYYSGLDLVYDLADTNYIYKGKVVDPKKGNVYNAEVWVDEYGNLILRGKLLFFGRNKSWVPATKEDFPKKFKMPDMKKFVPVIPQVN